MKKVGQFFFTFLPFLLSIGLEFLVMAFMMGISGLVMFTAHSGRQNFDQISSALVELWSESTANTCIMIFFSLSCTAVFGLWFYMRYNANYLPQMKKTFHPLTFLGILMLVPGLQYLSSYIISFTSMLFPSWLEAYMELIESAGLDTSVSFDMFLYSVLLAPISEELIFRGVTMSQAKKFFPFWAANLFQAVLFGVFHMNMIQGIYAFFLGLFLGYVCEKGGSFYHSILLHMLFNFWGTMLSEFFTIEDTVFSILFWFVFAVVMTTGGILVFRAGIGKLCKQSGQAHFTPLSPQS